jgi:chitin synthase
MQSASALLSTEHETILGLKDLEAAFCITLYNEPWERLSATIRSIVVSSESACALRLHRFVICIVADGRDRIAECTRFGLKQSGFMVVAPIKVDGVEIHATRHESSRLIGKVQSQDRMASVTGNANVVLCIKNANRGKLDSHRVFFDVMCRWISPQICYQVDAGSTISVTAISECMKRLDEDPTAAALGPCVTPEIPSINAGILDSWQYHDFATRQALIFPLESSLDFLSVLPGQACAIRWSALRSSPAGSPREAQDPIDAYLYGIAKDSSLRGLMYLSEDRVIGAAIVLDRERSWRLNYVPEAKVVTDSCDSMDELLRQRRRWMNSAMVCRFWLLLQSPRLARIPHRAFWLKGRQLSSILLQALIGLREFTAPAQLVALVMVIVSTALSAQSPAAGLLALFGIAASAELGVATMEIRTAKPALKFRLRRLGAALAFVSLAAFMAGLVIAVPSVALALALAPSVLGLVCMWLVLPSRSLPVLAKVHLTPVQQSLLFNLFLGYALWNLNDASWGTKGLIRTPRDSLMTKSLRNIRRLTLIAWIVVNAALICVAATVDGLVSGLNPIVESMWLMDAALVLYSLIWLSMRKLKRHTATSGLTRGR